MRIKCTILLWVLSAQVVLGQLETNPASLDFKQINTDHFKILFPEGFEQEGQRMANTLEHLHGPLSKSLGRAPHKIPVVLQNQGVISNGFVALSPRRSEFYTSAPQNYNLVGTNNWLDLLAMHEFRHIVQYEKTYDSRTKLAYYLFGQNGLLALGNAAVPSWFWEGDAVATETAFSPSGRGRIPDFNLLFRTTLLERGPYSYNKQHLGSFRNNVPNHYVTGYHLVSHVRRKHGTDVWGKVMHDALDGFYVPFTFSRAMKKNTGKRLVPTYRSMVRELDSLWTKQADSLVVTDATILTDRRSRTYTDYLYPQPLPDGGFVALKVGLSHIPQFVRFDANGRNEETLFTPGNLNNSPMLSVEQNKIVWSEFEYDPRWGTRNYSVIKTYDIETDEHRVLKRRTRLASPAFSPDAGTIAAIEVNTENNNSLVLLHPKSGEEIRRFSSPGNDFLAMPRWSPDGKSIVLLRTRNNKRTISTVNLETGVFTDLIPYTAENTGHPVWAGNYIYYNSPYSGIEHIYALDLQTRQQYRVAARRYAAVNPAIAPDGNTLLFNDYSILGYNVARMPNNPANWTPLEQVPERDIAYYLPLIEQEQTPNILENVPDKQYPVEEYNRLKHIFNPHSWAPTIDPDQNSISLALLSQDVLSTAITSVGYTRNISEKSGQAVASISYQGLYPVINVSAATGNRVVKIGEQRYQWHENSLTTGLALPLNLTRSKYRQFLTLSSNAEITSISDYFRPRRYLSEQTDGTLRDVVYSASYQRALRRSPRDLAGKFEQRALLYYNHTPLGGDYKGELFAATGRLAFPGLIKHHSLQFNGNYQWQKMERVAETYIFSSPIAFPRGYAYQAHEQFYGGSAQYRLPLWYPDIALGPFLYFQRFRANTFFDYGIGKRAGNTNYFQSVGLELSTDFNVMRLDYLLDVGVRLSYLPQEKKPVFEFLLANLGF